jgi:hypothetical protein
MVMSLPGLQTGSHEPPEATYCTPFTIVLLSFKDPHDIVGAFSIRGASHRFEMHLAPLVIGAASHEPSAKHNFANGGAAGN